LTLWRNFGFLKKKKFWGVFIEICVRVSNRIIHVFLDLTEKVINNIYPIEFHKHIIDLLCGLLKQMSFVPIDFVKYLRQIRRFQQVMNNLLFCENLSKPSVFEDC